MKRSYMNKLANSANFNNLMRYNQNRDYMGAAGVTEKLPATNRTLTYSIANGDSAASHTAYIFGANYDLDGSSLNANISVTVAESSATEVNRDISSGRPFKIVGLKYLVSSSATQFSNAISVISKQSTGRSTTDLLQPNTWRSAKNNITTQVDAINFSLYVDANTRLEWAVNAGETCTMIFNIVERLENANALYGRPTKQVADTLMQTGDAAFDAIQMG